MHSCGPRCTQSDWIFSIQPARHRINYVVLGCTHNVSQEAPHEGTKLDNIGAQPQHQSIHCSATGHAIRSVLFRPKVIRNAGYKGSIKVKKLFVGSLPPTTTEESFIALFSQFGTVRSAKLVKDLFSGKCKGFGFLEMEGHEARAAIAGLNGKDFNGKPMKVNFESPKAGRRRR
jgi:hypothetical protein